MRTLNLTGMKRLVGVFEGALLGQLVLGMSEGGIDSTNIGKGKGQGRAIRKCCIGITVPL